MTTFGITSAGFTLKRLADILIDTVAELEAVTDPVSGESLTPDLTDENDPLVQIINSFSDSIALCWEQLQFAYNQFDPLKATGAGLSGLVQLNNLKRQLGTYATTSFLLTGTPNKIIIAGKQISDMNNVNVFELPEFTFDSEGEAVVTGTCTIKGEVTALSGTLVNILTPTSGLTSATNTTDSSGGSNDETDAELRLRQQASTSGTARSVIDSVFAVLAGLEGVTVVRVYQNSTLLTDIRGLPAKSVAVVIVGGYDSMITDALFRVIPLGVEMYGTTETSIIDAQGISYPIKFTRPAEIDIFVDLSIEIVDSSQWTDDSLTSIKEAILAWAEEGAIGVGITEGYERKGFLPGEDVYASELYVPVNKQLGLRVLSLLIGTTSPAFDEVVSIGWDEISKFSSANISITYTVGGESS